MLGQSAHLSLIALSVLQVLLALSQIQEL